jgi:YVTN family beta-propeller protein
MKKLQVFKFCLISLVLLTVAISCDKDDDAINGKYEKGVFISNEGTFGAGNGSVSFYSTSGDTVSNNIFYNENNRPLGDVVQSVSVYNNNAYMVVNASNKVEVVTYNDFVETGVISDLTLPRYFAGVSSDKGYITQWGDEGLVKVVDLNTLDVIKSINVGSGPENILVEGSYAYVANSGGFGRDTVVSVIDINTDEVEKNINVGDNPADLVVDNEGNIWVLCRGYIQYASDYTIASQTSGKLVKIDTRNNTLEETIDLGESNHPASLEINKNGDLLYFGGGYGYPGVFTYNILNNTLSDQAFILKSLYGFSVNPNNGNIFALETPSFTDNGILYRYNSDGEVIANYEVGIGPNGAGFKRSREN